MGREAVPHRHKFANAGMAYTQPPRGDYPPTCFFALPEYAQMVQRNGAEAWQRRWTKGQPGTHVRRGSVMEMARRVDGVVHMCRPVPQEPSAGSLPNHPWAGLLANLTGQLAPDIWPCWLCVATFTYPQELYRHAGLHHRIGAGGLAEQMGSVYLRSWKVPQVDQRGGPSIRAYRNPGCKCVMRKYSRGAMQVIKTRGYAFNYRLEVGEIVHLLRCGSVHANVRILLDEGQSTGGQSDTGPSALGYTPNMVGLFPGRFEVKVPKPVRRITGDDVFFLAIATSMLIRLPLVGCTGLWGHSIGPVPPGTTLSWVWPLRTGMSLRH